MRIKSGRYRSNTRKSNLRKSNTRRSGSKIQKYKRSNRRSPDISATARPPSTVAKGIDGNYWMVIKVKNSHRWIPYMNKNQKDEIYETMDNGATPFKVMITPDKIFVFYCDVDDNMKCQFDELVLTIKNYRDVFIGYSPKNKMTIFSGGYGPKFNGNSILVETKKLTYTYIGESIFEFKTHDPIIDYISPVGNNDVPYPYAIGEDNIYLMLYNKYIPRNILKKNQDVYYLLFESFKKKNKNKKTKNKNLKNDIEYEFYDFDIKMIRERS